MSHQELTFFRGDDETLDIEITDSDGNAVDISGYKFWFTAKSNENDADADAEIGPTTGTITDAANGKAQISLTNSDTDIAVGSYSYDIQQKDASNKITTLVKGKLRITQDITQTTS